MSAGMANSFFTHLIMKYYNIQYCFQIEDGPKEVFEVRLDSESLENHREIPEKIPDWAKLNLHQCGNCTLSTETHLYCPAAVNMVELMDRFTDLLSHDKASVLVTTEDRTISSDTTIQRGACSLMGLLMATSGCPLTAFFKPMAWFHLPFASTEETIWRATSTYLLAQYFRIQNGSKPDIDFKGLTDIYNDIQTVNIAFAKRLRSACNHDSMVNAIILLDMFAKSMPSAIDESLEEIQYLFMPYLSQADTKS